MKEIDRDMDWSDAVRDSLKDYEIEAGDHVWSRVNNSLDVGATPRRTYRWSIVSGVVAAATLALLFLRSYDGSTPIDEPMVMEETLAQKSEIVAQDGIYPPENTPSITTIARDNVRESNTYSEIIPIEQPDQPKEEENVSPQTESQTESKTESKSQSREIAYSRPLENRILEKTHRQTELSLLYAGGLGSKSSSYSSMSRHMAINSSLSTYGASEIYFEDIYESYDISHHQPLSIGIRVQRELSQRLLIGSGAEYIRLVSDIETSSSKDTTKQQIHFVGIPIQLKYRFVARDSFALYVGAGGSVEYCVGADVGSRSIDERLWHYSADLNIGAEYRVNRWFGLYLEPCLSHYFTETRLRSIRNDSPTTFNIRLGVSFTM